MLLVTINEAFDRRGVDILLAIHRLGKLALSGSECASLIASDMVDVTTKSNGPMITYITRLNTKGKTFVAGWIKGEMESAIPS